MPNDERVTPQWFFDQLDAIFHFDMDVAATMENTKCQHFIDQEADGLAQGWWVPTVWCNPPYSRGQLAKFISKAVEEIRYHCQTVVMLTPGDFSTKWFQLIWKHATAVYFPATRLAFDNEPSGAKFASAVPIFGKLTIDQWVQLKELPGYVVVGMPLAKDVMEALDDAR